MNDRHGLFRSDPQSVTHIQLKLQSVYFLARLVEMLQFLLLWDGAEPL